MKKKLLFTAYSLELGGIEKALINYLKEIDYEKYDVTLILQKKEGLFLKEVPEDVHIYEYKISENKFVLARKIYNRSKLIYWKTKLKNKYQFSCSFATYSIPGAHLALAASNNNYLWIHGNYYILYQENEEKMTHFLDGIQANKFQNVVFVSKENQRVLKEHYKKFKNTIVCNNLINVAQIKKLAKEPCEYKKEEVPLFVNVGRHDEYQKRLNRIIWASAKLKKEGYSFKILFVGDGPDHEAYRKKIQEEKLEKEIVLVGKKQNPYPYYALADAILLSSEYEGYPVVFLESLVLGRPILSTKVSDWEELDGVYGKFCEKNKEAVYEMMKEFLDNGFLQKQVFDGEKYNSKIRAKLRKMIEH